MPTLTEFGKAYFSRAQAPFSKPSVLMTFSEATPRARARAFRIRVTKFMRRSVNCSDGVAKAKLPHCANCILVSRLPQARARPAVLGDELDAGRAVPLHDGKGGVVRGSPRASSRANPAEACGRRRARSCEAWTSSSRAAASAPWTIGTAKERRRLQLRIVAWSGSCYAQVAEARRDHDFATADGGKTKTLRTA
jgi:hypothetical protein